MTLNRGEKAIDRANIPGCWGVFVLTKVTHRLIEQLERQLRGKTNVHSDVSGVPRFACSSINNVTQIPRYCRTNDGHVLVVARVIYTANFYETATKQLSEVLKTNIFARVVKKNAIC